MDKKLYYILGTVFVITSGLIYTFERFISQNSLPVQGTNISQGGNVSSYTVTLHSSLFSNIFVSIFLVIGGIFFIRGYTKNKSN
ncbi:MAG: hypothetical protein ACYDG2_20310 [Ruminiclostridium sp.]